MNSSDDILKPRIKSATRVDPNLLLYAEDLLGYYSFDLGGQSPAIVLKRWAETYSVQWIRLAIVEALYQGRYKVVSVDQILQNWQRRQQAQPRFDADFEKLICERFPRNLMARSRQTGNQESAIAALAAEIHAVTQVQDADAADATQEAALAALARAVQRRQPQQTRHQTSVDAVIDYTEASVNTMTDHVKQRLVDRSGQDAASIPALKSIHQFTPTHANPELLAKLKAILTEQAIG
jgi:hypothetical protein